MSHTQCLVIFQVSAVPYLESSTYSIHASVQRRLENRWQKATKYSRQDLQGRPIKFIQRQQGIVPDGNLIEYFFKNQELANMEFEFIFCDEAHVAKNVGSIMNNLIRMMLARSVVYVTGTPIMSSFRDCLGFAVLLWLKADLHDKEFTRAVLRNLKGDISGLWHPDYDPFAEMNDIKVVKVRADSPGGVNGAAEDPDSTNQILVRVKTEGILHPKFDLPDEMRERLTSLLTCDANAGLYWTPFRAWQVSPGLL